MYLHKVLLVAAREDQPAQSGLKYQMACDYWLLNLITITNGFPMPNLDEYLQYI